MKKRKALLFFSCALFLSSCHLKSNTDRKDTDTGKGSTTVEPSKPQEYHFQDNVTYEDHNVLFTFPKDTSQIKVYSSKAKNVDYQEIATLENENTYYADDALSYYRFDTIQNGKKVTYGPYSYLKDYFQNPYIHVYSPEDDKEEIQKDFDIPSSTPSPTSSPTSGSVPCF